MNEKQTREPTEDELDIEGESTRLWFYQGVALSAVVQLDAQPGLPPRRGQTEDGLLRLIPFMKALVDLARENPGRMRQLWARELTEGTMPFGFAPPGMPKTEGGQ